MQGKQIQFSFLSALIAALVCAGAVRGGEADRPLGFGTADVPEITQQKVNQTSLRTVQLIIDAVQTARGSRRVELIADLGKCKKTEGEPTLYALLKDSSPETRAEAARSLGVLGDKAAIVNLEGLFSDVDPIVRREAVIGAANLGDVNATRVGITDADDAVKEVACAYAVMPQSIEILCEALQSLPTEARIAALESLATEKASGRWEAIAGCLKGSTSERYAALRALAIMKVADSARTILPMLQDGSGIVRREAVVALSHIISTREMQQIALRMLVDSDLTVRTAAAEALGENPTETAIPLLVSQLSQGNEMLRESARNALVAIGPAAIPAAAKLLLDSNDQRQEDGSYILGRLHSREHLQEHIALLKSPNWLVVKQAARSLEWIGDPSAGPALASVVGKYAQLQEDKSTTANDGLDAVAASILSGAHLRYSGLLSSIKPLIAQLDAEPTVRQAAIYAFGILGSASDSATCHELLSIVENPEEVLFTRFEAVKALGQLSCKSAEDVVASMDSSEGNLQFRWVARWARERITGQTVDFLVPPMNWSADVSITDLQGEPTGEQQVSGTIGFEGSYLAGAWVPVHLMFRNSREQTIDGGAAFGVSRGGESAVVRVPCVVPAKSAVNLVAYGYFPEKQSAGQQGATTVEWSDSDGRSIARAPIAAVPLSAREGFGTESNNTLDTVMLCLTDSTSEEGGRGYDVKSASNLAKAISERIGFAVKAELLPIQNAPRHPAGYESSRIVLLNADPDQLDMSQREALVDHIRSGGELLLCATPIKPGSWLWQYQPVFPLGQREVAGIQTGHGGDEIPFAQATKIVEATDVTGTDAVVIAGDSRLIHVAIRRVGLGCVVFTSFPVNALNSSDDRCVGLWKNVFQLTAESPRVLTQASSPLLGELVGMPTQPISMPLAIIAGYIATVFLAHRFFTNVARPWAYVVTVGIGIVGFVCLGATSILRAPRHELTEARLSTLLLGPAGGGRQEELIAFAGSDDPAFGFAADPNAILRSFGSSERETEQIQELPFAVTRAGVHPMEIKQIWSAESALDAKFSVKATARFGPGGLTMNVDDGLNEPLKRPLLVWGSAWSLPEIPAGHSEVVPLARNSRGDFVNTGAVRLDVDGLRSTMVANVLSAGGGVFGQERRGALLFGWVDHVRSAIHADHAKVISQNVLCVPVTVMPSEVRSTVSIDGSFCPIVPGPGAGAPYDLINRQWIPGNLSGEWIIGFAPPAEIGTLRPTRVVLNTDISAPTQTITLLRGMCAGGKVDGNIPGTVLCQWNQPISTQSATFDCDSNDFDSNGCVWIRLRVESKSGDPSSWFFRNLEMSYVANVTAGPVESGLKRD